ncbi:MULTISPECIES: hypothetical protein [unclassified Bradyrhizobium]|uniref:hypothetical protein n=1 Tax=unclassified Bradyrhizobium TaxID=2631580 RepID=UPI00291636EF|nr:MULTISPECIES: hypothetical protein [unclassified Bradyrhizobium]
MTIRSADLTRASVLAAACIGLNIGLNKIAVVLSLPIFMDTVGTILAAAFVPPVFVVSVGVVSNLIGGVVTHPAIPFYTGTQIVVALMAIYAFRRGWLSRLLPALAVGLAIGIVSAIVSAPITVVMFGGVTDGATALNAILMAAGQDIWTAVISGTIIVSSIDKVIAAALVYLLLRRLPDRLKLAGER